MEFFKEEQQVYIRLIKLYEKQQTRRFMADVRKNKKIDWDAQKRTPVYAFKATVGGKRGFVVLSEREAIAAGIPVEKAIADWVIEARDKDDKEEILE